MKWLSMNWYVAQLSIIILLSTYIKYLNQWFLTWVSWTQ
jgi:hypothetical protein